MICENLHKIMQFCILVVVKNIYDVILKAKRNLLCPKQGVIYAVFQPSDIVELCQR